MSKKNKIIIICSALLVVLVLCICTVFFIRKNSKKSIKIAFYELPENIVNVIQQQIIDTKITNISFEKISSEDLKNKNFNKKFDLLFTWKTKTTIDLEKSSKNISNSALELLPISIRKSSAKQLPLLMDHYEIAYSKDTLNMVSETVPETFGQLLEYLDKAKNTVFSPIIAEGSNDRVLMAFITSLTEALGGYEAYSNLINNFNTDKDFQEIMDKKLGTNGLDGSELTLKSVLDMIREWEEKGYTHPRWYDVTKRDIISFMEDGQVGILFNSLSFHREIPYTLITKYGSDRMPAANYRVNHALIAPTVVCLSFDKNSLSTEILNMLVSEEAQKQMSDMSMLAPTAYKGESYDRQADDVRFFAASSAYGPQTDLYSAVFYEDAQKAKLVADEIRHYLKLVR